MRWQSRERVKAIFVQTGSCGPGAKGTTVQFLEGDLGR